MTGPGKCLYLLCATPLLLALTGCSPHPAAGNWASATEAEHGFNRLEVTYEGRASLFEVGEEKAGRHCFWGGKSAHVITMTCKPAFDTALEERYQLSIGKDGMAMLMQDNNVVARFSRAAQ